MLGEHGQPIGVLLAHISLAVVLAVYLNHLLGKRKLLCAMMGSAAAFVIMAIMRTHMFSVDQTASLLQLSLDSPDDYWAHEDLRTPAAAEFLFLMVFVAPLVFAYYAVRVWEREPIQQQTTPYQFRLRVVMMIIWTVCLALGLYRWGESRSIPAVPLGLAATFMLLRPFRLVHAFWRAWKNSRRHSLIRTRLSQADYDDTSLLSGRRPNVCSDTEGD